MVGSDVGFLVDRRIRADLAIVDQISKMMNVQMNYWRCTSKMQLSDLVVVPPAAATRHVW